MVWLITSGKSRFCSINTLYSYKWCYIIVCFIKMPELPVTTKSKKKCQFKFSYVLIFLEIVGAVVLLVLYLSKLPTSVSRVISDCHWQYGKYDAFSCEEEKSRFFIDMLFCLCGFIIVSTAFIQIFAKDRPLVSLLFCCIGILTTFLISCFASPFYDYVFTVCYEAIAIPVAFFVSILQKYEESKSKND